MLANELVENSALLAERPGRDVEPGSEGAREALVTIEARLQSHFEHALVGDQK